jgi:hypothetical protein
MGEVSYEFSHDADRERELDGIEVLGKMYSERWSGVHGRMENSLAITRKLSNDDSGDSRPFEWGQA